MEKLVFCLWRAPDQEPLQVRANLLDMVAPAVLEAGVHGLRIEAEEPEGGVLRVGANPDGGVLTASVSVWLDSYDERDPIEAALDDAGVPWWGWLVCESVPRAHGERRDWPDGQQSPGLSILTVFDKAAGVDDETFYRIWHGEHTPLSFEIHPLWLYVRNQVMRPITPGAPRARGIVYEGVAHDEDMLDLTRFFGCPEEPARLGEMVDRVNGHMATFADVDGLQCTPTREWIFKTFST